MSKFIDPIFETTQAISDYVDNPENIKRLLHLEAMLHELHDSVKKEVIKRELSRKEKGI